MAKKKSKPRQIGSVNSDREFWTQMIYADPGAGKTFLAGTGAQNDHDTLIIRPPQDHTDTIAIHFPDVEVDEAVIHSWDDADEIHEYLRHEDHGYRWVWADSLSLLQEVGLDDIMEKLVAEKPHRDLYVPDRGEYGENMNRISRWVRYMSALDFNFGMTAHVFRYTFPATGEDMLMPWIQGKQMPEKICAYANVVGYLSVVEHNDQQVRVLHTQPHGDYYAKDGFGAFKPRIVNPTIPKLEAAVAEAKTKEASKKKGSKRKGKSKKDSNEEEFTFE